MSYIIIYIAGIIIMVYLAIIIARIKKIPDSISDTYYLRAGNWFTILMFVTSFLITPGLLEITNGSNWQFISFLTGTGMTLVGAAPKFKTVERVIHYIGATTLLIGSLLWIILFGNSLILLTWISIILWWKSKKKIFWCEIICLFNIFISLL